MFRNLMGLFIAVRDMDSRNFVQIQTTVTHSHTTLVIQNSSNSFPRNSCYTKLQ